MGRRGQITVSTSESQAERQPNMDIADYARDRERQPNMVITDYAADREPEAG